MRTGLVLVGVAGLVLGIGLAVVGTLNYPSQVTYTAVRAESFAVQGQTTLTLVLSPPSGASSFRVSYTSAVPLTSALATCSGNPSGCLLDQASNSTSASWTLENPPATVFLDLTDKAVQNAPVTVTTQTVTKGASGFSLPVEVLVLGGAVALATGGALGLFLGLFLKGNPYHRENPPEMVPEEEPPKE